MIVRDAQASDAERIAIVHVRAWRSAYRGLLPDAFLDDLRPEHRIGRHPIGDGDAAGPLTLVAVEGDVVQGFTSVGPARDDDAPGAAEMYTLYVDPARWRRGVGTGLHDAACERLRRARYADAVLWVLVGNVGAERFYVERGWRRDGAERREDPWCVPAHVRRYRRSLA